MSVRTMSARAEPRESANPPTAAAEAVTRKPRRDGLEVVAVTTSVSIFGFDCPVMSNLLQSKAP